MMTNEEDRYVLRSSFSGIAAFLEPLFRNIRTPHSHTPTLTHTYTLAHLHSLTPTLTHTYTLTHLHSHTRARAHTLTTHQRPARWEDDPFFADVGFKVVKRVHPGSSPSPPDSSGGGGGGGGGSSGGSAECVLAPIPLHEMVPVHSTAPKDTLHRSKQAASAALYEAEQLMRLGNVLQSAALLDGGEADAAPTDLSALRDGSGSGNGGGGGGAAAAAGTTDADADADADAKGAHSAVVPASPPSQLPFLHSFTLTGAHSTLRELADVWWRMPELQRLVLDTCALDRHSDVLDGLPSLRHGGICAATAICPKLREISFRACRGFCGIEYTDLAAAAAHAPHLEQLDLTWQMQYMQMDPCMLALSHPEHGFKNLQSIALQGVSFSDAVLLQFAQGCQQLRHLWLVGCGHDGRLTGKGVAAALGALPPHQMLSLSLSACAVDNALLGGTARQAQRPGQQLERRWSLVEMLAKSHGKSLRVLSLLSLDSGLHLSDLFTLSHSFPTLERFEYDGDDFALEPEYSACDPCMLNCIAFCLLLDCPSLRWLRLETFSIPWEVFSICPRLVEGGVEAAARNLAALDANEPTFFWAELSRCLDGLRVLTGAALASTLTPTTEQDARGSQWSRKFHWTRQPVLAIALDSFGSVADHSPRDAATTACEASSDVPAFVVRAFTDDDDQRGDLHQVMPAQMCGTSKDVLHTPKQVADDNVVAELVQNLTRVHLFGAINASRRRPQARAGAGVGSNEAT